MAQMVIRNARLADLDGITEIYNEAIRATTATFDTEPKTSAGQLAWFEAHGPRHPILVAELLTASIDGTDSHLGRLESSFLPAGCGVTLD